MIVSSHLDGCISLTPFLMVSVASALSQSESGLFLPPGSDGGLLSGPMALFLEETIEVPMRVGSSSSLSGLRTVDFFPVFPESSHLAPSHRFRLRRSGRLVGSGSSEQESAQSVRSFLSLRHILAFVRYELESTLVPSLTVAFLG